MNPLVVRRLILSGAGFALFCASVRAEPPDSFRLEDANFGSGSGIAGVDFTENFESFNLGPGCGQQGWTCFAPFEIVNSGLLGFGQRTARSTASGTASGTLDMVSPVFPLETGTIQADMIITNPASPFQFDAVNTRAGANGFFNTRVRFEGNGVIYALQIQGQPPCTSSIFAATAGTWTSGVKMRIGIEVLPGSILRVYKDGVQIFQGHDIAQFCTVGNPDIGINQIRNFNSNIGASAQMYVDNIASAGCGGPLPLCSADVQAPYGVVDVGDLLQVISDWGVTGPPRPRADCAPPPDGDCYVDVQDLLTVISQWGPCPAPTGACCTGGQCAVTTEEACADGGGAYIGDGTRCADILCAPNDECANATPIFCGTTVIPAAQIAGGSVSAGDPMTFCELQGGGPFLKSSSLWYRVNTGGATSLKVSTCDSPNTAVDMVMGVYTGCGGNEVACGEDECTAPAFGLPATTCINVQPNTDYIILLQRYAYSSNPVGDVHLTVDCTCSLPSNDLCIGAQALTIDGPGVSTTLAGATTDAGFSVCNVVRPGVGRWHTVVGNGTRLTASTCSSPFEFWDAAINVYCGSSCGDLVCVAGANDNSCSVAFLQESVTWCSAPAAANQTYWILVHSQSGSPSDGNYTIAVTSGEPCMSGACGPDTYSHCQNALPISLGTTAFNTTGASTDGVPNTPGVCDDSGQNQTHHDIWYTYHATQSGALTVTTCAQLGGSADYNSDIVIYSNAAPGGANCPPLDSARIACNDDDVNHACGTGPPWASTAIASVTAGQVYRIRVGGWADGSMGTGVLNLVIDAPQLRATTSRNKAGAAVDES